MYAVEMSDAPDFRRNTEDMYYSQAPSRFGLNTAYVEVWLRSVTWVHGETSQFDLMLTGLGLVLWIPRQRTGPLRRRLIFLVSKSFNTNAMFWFEFGFVSGMLLVSDILRWTWCELVVSSSTLVSTPSSLSPEKRISPVWRHCFDSSKCVLQVDVRSGGWVLFGQLFAFERRDSQRSDALRFVARPSSRLQNRTTQNHRAATESQAGDGCVRSNMTSHCMTSLTSCDEFVLFAGDRFDVKDFHERVLQCGSVPINILQQVIDDMIANKWRHSQQTKNIWRHPQQIQNIWRHSPPIQQVTSSSAVFTCDNYKCAYTICVIHSVCI